MTIGSNPEDSAIEIIQRSEQPQSENRGRFERVDPNGLIRPGDYWRARVDVDFEGGFRLTFGRSSNDSIDYEAEADEVLLVADVRKDGDQDHTVVLVPHPLKGDPQDRMRILVHEFLDKFEFEPNGESIREAEMAGVNTQINVVQGEIAEAQRNPAYLNAQCMAALEHKPKKKGTASNLPALQEQISALNVLKVETPSLSDALTAASSNDIQRTIDRVMTAQSIAEAQGEWFSNKAGRLGELTQQLAPFYVEKAQVALARTNQAVSRAKVLLESVQTLTLFTGQDVNVRQLCAGDPAPVTERIHLYQRKLWVNEEMSYHSTYVRNEIDYRRLGAFSACIEKNPDFIDQLIPAPRGVVLMGYSRQSKNFDDDPILNEVIRRKNARSWLLVRDGANVWIVDSPIDSHEGSKRLFPSKNVDGEVFGGVDGRRVTPEDLRWTDKLDELHALAVHFRRFAVLLAGLISREVCFKGVNFNDLFYASTTSRVYTLIFDDSGEDSLPDNLETLDQFLRRVNCDVRSGSRLMVDWRRVLQPETAPVLYRKIGSDKDRWYCGYTPETEFGPATLEREGEVLFVKGSYNGYPKNKVARVKIFDRGKQVAPEYSFLCIDRLDVATMNRMMASRTQRTRFLDYMGMFRQAINHSEALAAEEKPIREFLTEALVSASLAPQARAEQLVDESMAAWRSDGNRSPIVGSAEATVLLDRLYRLTEQGRIDPSAIDRLAAEKGLKPLQLVIEAGGRLLLYTEPPTRDDRVARQLEVQRWVVRTGARTLRLEAPILEPMYRYPGDLTVLHEWPDAEAFKTEGVPSTLLPRKLKLLGEIDAAADLPRRIFAGRLTDDEALKLIERYHAQIKAERDRRERWYIYPTIYAMLPLAMVRTKNDRAWVIFAREDVLYCFSRNLQNGDIRSKFNLSLNGETRAGLEARSRLNKPIAEQDISKIQVIAVPVNELSYAVQLIPDSGLKSHYRVTWYEITADLRYRSGQTADLSTLHRALSPQQMINHLIPRADTPKPEDWITIYGSINDSPIVSVYVANSVALGTNSPFISWLTSATLAAA